MSKKCTKCLKNAQNDEKIHHYACFFNIKYVFKMNFP